MCWKQDSYFAIITPCLWPWWQSPVCPAEQKPALCTWEPPVPDALDYPSSFQKTLNKTTHTHTKMNGIVNPCPVLLLLDNLFSVCTGWVEASGVRVQTPIKWNVSNPKSVPSHCQTAADVVPTCWESYLFLAPCSPLIAPFLVSVSPSPAPACLSPPSLLAACPQVSGFPSCRCFPPVPPSSASLLYIVPPYHHGCFAQIKY